jgi:hypothetical protein
VKPLKKDNSVSPLRGSNNDNPLAKKGTIAGDTPGSGHGASEGSKKTVISAKDMPTSKGKKDPIIKRDISPVALANKEAE